MAEVKTQTIHYNPDSQTAAVLMHDVMNRLNAGVDVVYLRFKADDYVDDTIVSEIDRLKLAIPSRSPGQITIRRRYPSEMESESRCVVC